MSSTGTIRRGQPRDALREDVLGAGVTDRIAVRTAAGSVSEPRWPTAGAAISPARLPTATTQLDRVFVSFLLAATDSYPIGLEPMSGAGRTAELQTTCHDGFERRVVLRYNRSQPS